MGTMDWQRVVNRIAAEVEDHVDRVKLQADRFLLPEREPRLVPYRSFGTADRVHVRGRVLRGPAPGPPRPEDRWWVNLANTYRRLETDEVAHAPVRVLFRGTEAEGRADQEGHFDIELAPRDPLPNDRLWHDAHIELPERPGASAAAMVCVPTRPRFGVISDLDDTVVRTEAANLIRVAREVLFGNAHTRIPFPGVGAFYRALHTSGPSGRNPIFYVSSSPWNLYDVLSEFMRLHDIPAGPMALRDWGVTAEELMPTGHRDHKRAAIDRILDTYPDLAFILVGDSGQEDPEIYREVLDDHPDRVLAIYIRSVFPRPERIESIRGLASEIESVGDDAPELVLVDDTVEAAQHAARRGWLHPDAIPAIARTCNAER